MINNVNLYSVQPRYCRLNNRKQAEPQTYTPVQTSLYNTKGLNLSFGSIVKGQDFIEEECIRMLRKVRENRYRKFAEDDIKEIITELHSAQKPSEKQNILQEVLEVENEDNGSKPDKKMIKQLVHLIAGRPEAERFAILEFAENELKYTTEPLTAFNNIPRKKQDKLVKILNKINNINEPGLFKSDRARIETIDSLYDLFRVPVYAEEDLRHMSKTQADSYKLEQLHLLRDDVKFFQKDKYYSDEKTKSKVTSTAYQIYNYFLENVI